MAVPSFFRSLKDDSVFSVGRFELDYARTFDFRADKVLESLTNSLKRLKLTYIDVCFVQIHDADFTPQENIILYETLEALEMARHSGKIRYIGLTGYELGKLGTRTSEEYTTSHHQNSG
uniref:Aldo keto reductase domain containing protein n=1 Tax=Haemonchus contortus TaxID=6289 RepID=W6NFK4_HAECO